MRYRFQARDKLYDLSIDHTADGGYRAVLEGLPYEFEVLDVQPGQISLLFEGRPVTVYWAAEGGDKWVSLTGCTYKLEKPAPRSARRGDGRAAESSVRAPMPAQVRAVEVAPGDEVEKAQTLLLLEAMKMEIRIQAPRAGRVARLLVQPGQTVNRDQMLVELE